MFVIYAIDGLEIDLVEKYDCQNLKQRFYGKTNISEFSEARTIVLWSSFATGQNKEEEVLKLGNKDMWNVKWPIKDTFFSKFNKPEIIDLPGFNYNTDQHQKQRKLLAGFFKEKDKEAKEKVRAGYNKLAFDHHKVIKAKFLKALDKDYDLVLGYFGLFDLIGHLNFGNELMIKMIYKELDEIAAIAKEKAEEMLILSDHGMFSKGMFGDHSDYGYWSTSFKDLGKPRITDIGKAITSSK